MKIMIEPGVRVPTRAHSTDAGLDIYARESKVVPAHGSEKFDTGVHIELPTGTMGEIKSKSGLNVNHGIISDGVVDVNYTGSIVIKLYNLSDEDYTVNKGDKISQLVVVPILTPELDVVDKLEVKGRGNNGFGSTGKQ